MCLRVMTDTEVCPGYSPAGAHGNHRPLGRRKSRGVPWCQPRDLGMAALEPRPGCAAGIARSRDESPTQAGDGAARVWWTLQGSGSALSRLLTAGNFRKRLDVLSRDGDKCCNWHYSMQLVKETAFLTCNDCKITKPPTLCC